MPARGERQYPATPPLDLPSIGLIAIPLPIALGAVLAGVDGALAAMGLVRIEAIRDAGGLETTTAARVARDLRAIRARYLAGRALCLAGSISCAWAFSVAAGLPEWVAFVATAGVALLYSLAAEVTTGIARGLPGEWTLRVTRWLRPVEIVLAPFGAPLVLAGAWAENLVPDEGEPTENTERIAALTVEKVIDEEEESGTIDEAHADLLRSVLEFKDTVAREVMVPRTRMVAFDVEEGMGEVLKKMVIEGHSRYPVYRGTVDQMEGVLYAKDVYRYFEGGAQVASVKLAELIRRPIIAVAETQKISSVLRSMQARRSHIAVVIDEFGGTAGVVTLEDILEEIVGEIEDEHDDAEPRVKQIAPRRYVADAGISIYDLEEFMGHRIPRGDGEYESLGGLLVETAGRVPQAGESVALGDVRFLVRDADEKRVRRVEVHRDAPQAAE
jgi:putative hemolysin